MAAKGLKISDALAGGCLADMVAQAKRSAGLAAAVRQSLPHWVDSGQVTILIGPARQVRLQAPPAIAGLLRQILPALKERLRKLGYRTVRVELP